MGPPEAAKPASTLTGGSSSFNPRMFPTTSNGPAGAWKSGIDVPEWAHCGPSKARIDDRGCARHLFLEYFYDCFEWVHQRRQSQHRPSRGGPVVLIRECFRLLRMGLPEHGKAVSMSPNGPTADRATPASMIADGPSICFSNMLPTALNGPTRACKASINPHGWVQ